MYISKPAEAATWCCYARWGLKFGTLYKHLSTFICDVCRHEVHCIISEKPMV